MGKLFYYFSKGLYSLGRTVYHGKVVGKDRILKKGKCIYACNHLSAVDIPLTQVHMPGYRRYIGKKEFTRKKFSSLLLSKYGVIFLNRDKPDLSSMREVFKVLDADGQIFIFPEGTRNKGDEQSMTEIKGGLAIFAAKSGAPVIPVLIYTKPRPFRKNYIYFGETIDICPSKGRMPSADEIKRLTDIYQYEFARHRTILNDYVACKRWKRKYRLMPGTKSPALLEWEEKNKNPADTSLSMNPPTLTENT